MKGQICLEPGDAGSLLRVRALDELRRVVVGDGVAEAAATITLLRNDRTSALASTEAAAAGRAVGVLSADAGDELCTRRRGGGCRCRGRGGSSSTTLGDTRGGLSVRALDLLRRVVVRELVAEATATVALLRNNGAGALAGVEATAARGAVGVALARTSDELGALRNAGKDRCRRGHDD
jgi:hypothetical protein